MLFVASIDWSKLIDLTEYWFAFLGALLGALTAIWLTKRQDAERKYLAKKALADRLHFNAERATQMLGQFGSGSCPNYLFDTTGIIIWLTRAADIMDEQLITDINWHRYQLDHLNAKLSVYYITAIASQSSLDAVEVVESKSSILKHLEVVI